MLSVALHPTTQKPQRGLFDSVFEIVSRACVGIMARSWVDYVQDGEGQEMERVFGCDDRARLRAWSPARKGLDKSA